MRDAKDINGLSAIRREEKFTPRDLINRFIHFPDQPITELEIGNLILRSAVEDILLPFSSGPSATPFENKAVVRNHK